MPHFIIDCSEEILKQKSPEYIMQVVYDTAKLTKLFVPEEINFFASLIIALAERENSEPRVYGTTQKLQNLSHPS